MVNKLFLGLLLILSAFDATFADCDFINELSVHGGKVIEILAADVPDKKAILGCWRAMCLGNIDECNPKHFSVPQFPSCDKCIKHDKFEEKAKDCNLKKYEAVIDNAFAAEDIDTDEICEKLPKIADQAINAYKNYLEGGPEAAQAGMNKFCEKDPETCEQMKAFPRLLESKLGVSFAEFMKAAKGTAKSKGMVLSSSALKGVSLMFGGDDFGDLVSQCVTEAVSSAGKGQVG